MGTLWRRSGSFEFDASGERAGGAKAYFFVGDTTTALSVYEDSDLTTPYIGYVTASGAGRWPAVYIDYIDIFDEQIKTSSGVELTYYTGIANPDPTFSGTVDDTSPGALQTGDWKFSDVDETKTGFVRANGRTIGNGSSGATERAHADCEALFTYRWAKIGDGQAAVSGGRGASAAADWAANKTIALPDMRGCVPIGLDTMGASAASRLVSAPFTNGSSATAGSLCGLNTHTLTTAQLPFTFINYASNFTPAGTISYAGNFTPSGTNSYAGNFTPAGTISYAGNFTPAGSVTSPTITVTSAHTHAGGGLFDVSANGAFTTGPTTAVIAVNNGGSESTGGIDSGSITAALDGLPVFTGTAAALPGSTFNGTGAALPVSTFNGTGAALPAATFNGTGVPLPAASFGSGTLHNIVSSGVLGTVYIKL